VAVLFGILIFFGLFLAGRLFSLQVLEYEKWAVKAVNQQRIGRDFSGRKEPNLYSVSREKAAKLFGQLMKALFPGST